MYGVSLKTFKKWLQTSRALHTELIEYGYEHSQKQFTIKQTEIIFEHLLPPETSQDSFNESFQKVLLKPYSKTKLAQLYGWDWRTLIRYMEKTIPVEDYNQLFKIQYTSDLSIIRVCL